MALDLPRRELMKVLRAMARDGKGSFALDDLEQDRYRIGVSRAWMYSFLDDIGNDGTCMKMIGRTPARWRFTDEFRRRAIRSGQRARQRQRKAENHE